MKFCTSCGKEVKEGSEYCLNCGAAVGQKKPQKPSQTDVQAPKKGVGGLIAIGILAIVFAWIPVVGLVLGIVGLILGIKHKNESKSLMITSIIGLVLSVLIFIASIALIALGVVAFNDFIENGDAIWDDETINVGDLIDEVKGEIDNALDEAKNEVQNTISSSSTMTCSGSGTMSGFDVELKYVITYKDDEVTKVVSTEKILDQDYDVLKEFKDRLDDTYSDYEDLDGFNYESTISGGNLTSKVVADYKKMDLDELLKIDPSNKLIIENGKIVLDKVIEVYKDTDIDIVCE